MGNKEIENLHIERGIQYYIAIHEVKLDSTCAIVIGAYNYNT